MKKLKIKTCKYPKCTKEVPSDKSSFCIEHSRILKEKGKKARDTVGVLVILGATTVANSVIKKKLQ